MAKRARELMRADIAVIALPVDDDLRVEFAVGHGGISGALIPKKSVIFEAFDSGVTTSRTLVAISVSAACQASRRRDRSYRREFSIATAAAAARAMTVRSSSLENDFPLRFSVR
jgi:hypothetical protein